MTEPRVFVVVNEDSHYDTDVSVFATQDAAITYARDVADEGSRGRGYDEEQIEGWLFYANYSPETGSVWVMEKGIQ